VKVYIPPPGGPLGLVYRLAKNKDERLYLDHLAFGVRHYLPGSAAESTTSRLTDACIAAPRNTLLSGLED
jgi:hypothetical protein